MDHLEEFRIPKETLEKLKDPDYLNRQLMEGKTFQEIIGYTPDVMEKFYGAAHQLFQQQKYEDAAEAFVFLTTLNPRVHNYWLGLGMSEHLTHEFDAALMAYSMAAMTDPKDPLPHYHSAACYDANDDLKSAIASLELAIQAAGDLPEHASIKAKSLQVLERMKK